MARKEQQANQERNRFPQHRSSVSPLPQSAIAREARDPVPPRYFAMIQSFSPLSMGSDAGLAMDLGEYPGRKRAA